MPASRRPSHVLIHLYFNFIDDANGLFRIRQHDQFAA